MIQILSDMEEPNSVYPWQSIIQQNHLYIKIMSLETQEHLHCCHYIFLMSPFDFIIEEAKA